MLPPLNPLIPSTNATIENIALLPVLFHFQDLVFYNKKNEYDSSSENATLRIFLFMHLDHISNCSTFFLLSSKGFLTARGHLDYMFVMVRKYKQYVVIRCKSVRFHYFEIVIKAELQANS